MVGCKPGAAGGHFAPRRGENEAHPGPTIERERLLSSSHEALFFCLSEFLSLTTLPSSAQMKWQLCAVDRTWDF